MKWRGKELTEDSLLMYAWNGNSAPEVLVRVGDCDHYDAYGMATARTTHLEYIRLHPNTMIYRWPELPDYMEHACKSSKA